MANLLIVSILAVAGIVMTPLPMLVVAGTLAAAVGFGLVLNVVKVPVFKRLRIA